MASPTSPADLVRISCIAGQYLVFDPDHVALLRRKHHVCAVLVGTTPQNPGQNVFQSVPIQLTEEEAAALVDMGAAVIVDELAAHLLALNGPNQQLRQRYVQSLKAQRNAVALLAAQEDRKRHEEALTLTAQRASKKGKNGSKNSGDGDMEPATVPASASGQDPVDTAAADAQTALRLLPTIGLTPTTSKDLVSPLTPPPPMSQTPRPVPFFRHLLSQGYYMTPGLRFGAHYSVYPGDPLRFHAHFLSNHYGWNEPVPIMDLIGNGRLGTAVKKGFLVGGEVPGEDGRVRAFTIEWAGM